MTEEKHRDLANHFVAKVKDNLKNHGSAFPELSKFVDKISRSAIRKFKPK